MYGGINIEMPYNPDIHHRHSIRLQGYDYSQAGLYFVTICVQNRECLFGHVSDEEMFLNEYGEIVQKVWNELPQHYMNIRLGEFIVMPNHIHGIIAIVDGDDGGDGGDVRAGLKPALMYGNAIITNTSSATPTITRVLPITSFPIPPNGRMIYFIQ